MMKLSQPIKSLALISLAAILSACGTSNESTAPIPAAPEVSVAEVLHERLTEWDTFTGRLEAPQTVDLRPRVSGYIERVSFEEGDIVNAGDPLFVIDDRSFKAEVERREAAWQSAMAKLKLAASEFERAEKLIARAAIAVELLDNRRSRLREAEAGAKSAKASLDLAKLELSYTQVDAPITGRVSRALITAGNYVAAGQSVLTRLVSTDKVYAYFDADEQTYLNYVKLAKAGERPSARTHKNLVFMGLASDSDFPYQGHIDFVDNEINPSSGTIRGRAVFDNSDSEFIPGLFARIKLAGSASYQGILIDDKAIGTDLNNKFVLVLNADNQVTYRAVTLGEKINGLRIIKSGLTAEETIVVNGLQRVRPGTIVNPVNTKMTSDANLAALRDQQRAIDASHSPALASDNNASDFTSPASSDNVVGG
ncbi:MAG: efflux RND transporter periplasmic adaptor subunit [Pseudomonadota bacterium]